MKRVAIGLAILTVVLVAGFFVLYSSLGSIITQAVNFKGPKIVQAKVRLKETIIDAASGKGSMHGLIIGNPKGFKTENAFKVDQIQIALDTGSVASKTVIINKIEINAPEITYELGGNGSNIDAIERNVDAFVKQYSGASPAKEKSAPQKSRTKMVVDHIYVKGGKINISATLMGGKSMTVSLPDIHLQDIGKKENGATAGEVAEAIIDALNKSVHKAINPLHLENIGNAAGKVAVGAKDVVQETVKGVGSTLEKGAKGVGDAVSNIFGK